MCSYILPMTSPIHTYIHVIGHYNPSIRITDIVSHTTYVVCVNFIPKFKVDSERQKLFMAILFALRHLLKGNRLRNTFRILFWCLAWGSNPGFTSNKPTHYYLLELGDFSTTPARVAGVCNNHLFIWKSMKMENCWSWVVWIYSSVLYFTINVQNLPQSFIF